MYLVPTQSGVEWFPWVSKAKKGESAENDWECLRRVCTEQEWSPASWPYRLNWAALLPFVWAPPALLQSQQATIRWWFPRTLQPLLITLYCLYSYPFWGAEHFGQGQPVVHIPSTHPEYDGSGAIPYVCRVEPFRIHPRGGSECSPHPITSAVICLSWYTPCYVILIFGWTMTMKKIRRDSHNSLC